MTTETRRQPLGPIKDALAYADQIGLWDAPPEERSAIINAFWAEKTGEHCRCGRELTRLGMGGGFCEVCIAAMDAEDKVPTVEEHMASIGVPPAYRHCRLDSWKGQVPPAIMAWIISPRSNLVIFGADTGTGKALRSDQRILTPAGWKPIGDAEVGWLVYGSDGLPKRINGVFRLGKRVMFRVTTRDGASVVCDAEHLWLTRRTRPHKKVVWETKTTDKIDVGRDFIPSCKPIVRDDVDLPLDPYLVGILIGDGALSQRTPRISKPERDLREMLGYCTLPVPVYPVYRTYSGRCCEVALRAPRGQANTLAFWLEALEMMPSKSVTRKIPKCYLEGSVRQRLALLQGILDTDGHPIPGCVDYSTSSSVLAAQVQELVWSLGGTCHPRPRKTKCADSFRSSIALPPGIPPFRLRRKADKATRVRQITRRIVSIAPEGIGDAVCIKVDAEDGLFVTEGCMLTHNTHLATAALYSLRSAGHHGWWTAATELARHLSLEEFDPDQPTYRKSSRVEYLLVDDLGSEDKAVVNSGPRVRALLDERHRWNRRSIITTNLTVEQLTEMDPRLASRLLSGTVVERQGEDQRWS